nr:MAG TPA: hypothetical protein [Caudoviricetes sp.]
MFDGRWGACYLRSAALAVGRIRLENRVHVLS